MQPSCHWFHGFLLHVLWSADPPSKENPYEDIELERSCLGSKCISPVFSSSVPDTPTKVSDCKRLAVRLWICSKLHCDVSSPDLWKTRVFSTKLGAPELQSLWASQNQQRHWHLLPLPHQPPVYTQQPRRHSLSLRRSLQPQTEEDPQGMNVWEASCQDGRFMTNWRRFSAGLLLLQSKDECQEPLSVKIKWL